MSDFIYVTTPDVASSTSHNIPCLTSYQQVFQRLEEESIVAIDLETYVPLHLKGHTARSALNPHTSNISLLIIKPSSFNTTYIIDWLAFEPDPLFIPTVKNWLISRTTLVAHNSSFEIKFLKKHIGVLLFNFWCTRVAAQLIGNGLGGRFYQQIGGYSYKSLCFNFLNVNIKGKQAEQIDDWYTRPISEDKLKYAYHDVEYLLPLKELFEEILITPSPDYKYYKKLGQPWGFGCKELLDLEMEYISCEADMEYNGLPFNQTVNDLFQNGIYNKKLNRGILIDLATELADHFGYKKDIDLITGKTTVGQEVISSLRSSPKLTAQLNKKFGKDTFKNAEAAAITRLIELYDLINKGENDPYYNDEEREAYHTLLSLENQDNFSTLKLLAKFKKFSKQNDMNLSKYVNSSTNRIHPNFNSLGARTGRTTSSACNAQNINSRTALFIKIIKKELVQYFTNILRQSKSKPSHEL
jgi:hypothetical protein